LFDFEGIQIAASVPLGVRDIPRLAGTPPVSGME
jgi:hypothetical protein